MSERTCGQHVTLCADVVAATYGPPDDQPREMHCELEHPHHGLPHLAEGWAWRDGAIWKVEMTPDGERVVG